MLAASAEEAAVAAIPDMSNKAVKAARLRCLVMRLIFSCVFKISPEILVLFGA
jgi:hypothetical protein